VNEDTNHAELPGDGDETDAGPGGDVDPGEIRDELPGDGDETDAGPGGDVDPGEIRDELPADLNASEFVGPYMFPNNSRRRIPGVLYLFAAVLLVAVWGIANGDDSAAVNGGVLAAGIGLAVFGAFHLVTGWDLAVDENDALVVATRAAGFPIGHASAQMGWRGFLSRPTWRLLVYSNEPQPTKRGLVLVDGVDGEVLDVFVEDNPEDWSDLEGV
jgi:hypothetical protein